MEVKIQIPDNCELIQDGNTWTVREKEEDSKPKSWEEFCKKYPIKKDIECYIDNGSNIIELGEDTRVNRALRGDRNLCVSREETEAFLALMQLRQLRKAWIGDWDISANKECSVILYDLEDGLIIYTGEFSCYLTMSFPTEEMASEFLVWFKDLLEKAKVLL